MRGLTALLLLAGLLILPALAAAQNTPPVADAGEDQDVIAGDLAVLAGQGSDADADPIVSWLWTLESTPAGSTAFIFEPGSQDTFFITDLVGEYVVSLVVGDGTDFSAPDTMVVTATEILPPVAVATADVTSGTSPLLVQFDGSGSIDPHGGGLRYFWDFGDSTSASTEVAPAHIYLFGGTRNARLTVIDSFNQGDEAPTIVINVSQGTGTALAALVPDSVAFGPVEIGQTVGADAVVANVGDGGLAIVGIEILGGNGQFTISSPTIAVVPPGGELDLGLQFSPSQGGISTAIVRVENATGTVQFVDLSVSGQGTVVAVPALSPSLLGLLALGLAGSAAFVLRRSEGGVG